MYEYFADICKHPKSTPGFLGGQKQALDSLEMELRTVVSSPVMLRTEPGFSASALNSWAIPPALKHEGFYCFAILKNTLGQDCIVLAYKHCRL